MLREQNVKKNTVNEREDVNRCECGDGYYTHLHPTDIHLEVGEYFSILLSNVMVVDHLR